MYFFLDLECLLKKLQFSQNNPEKSQKEKLDMSLPAGQCLKYVHLIKKKISLIAIEEKMIYNEQEICYICKENFYMDKMIKIILTEKSLKIIVIIQKNLEELIV